MKPTNMLQKHAGKLTLLMTVTLAAGATARSALQQGVGTHVSQVLAPSAPPSQLRLQLASSAGAVAQRRAASKRELYAMLFSYAVHVETVADEDTRNGRDSSQFRNHIQLASGLTSAEYAYVLASAKRFANANDTAHGKLREWRQVVREQRTANRRIGSSLRVGLQQPLRAALAARKASLDEEIATLGLELGQQRAAVLLNYLQTKYTQRNIGNAAAIAAFRAHEAAAKGQVAAPKASVPVAAGVPTVKTQATPLDQPEYVTLDSGWSCDEYDFTCADAQIAYRGPGGEVDLYAYSDVGDYAEELGEDGEIELESIFTEGDLTTNGGGPVEYCSADDYSCSGYGPLSADTYYDWDATGDIVYYADCGDGTDDWCEYDEDYTAEINAYIDAPDINQFLPGSLTPGSSGTFTIDGDGLISPFENQPTVSITNQGSIFSSFAVQSFSTQNGTITVSYQVLTNPTVTGNQTVTVNNGFGEDGGTLTIEAAPPVITSTTVSGGYLQAGETQLVTLSGDNFGTGTPQLSLANGSPSGVSIVSGSISYTPANGGTAAFISFQVSTSATSSAGEAAFQLGAQDSTGIEYANSSDVAVNALDPAPQILRVGSPGDAAACTNGSATYNGANETTVFAGELLLLCVLPPPPPIQVVSQSWTLESIDDITGGLTNYAGTGQPSASTVANGGGGTEAANPNPNGSSYGFYFVNPNTTETVTYTWVLNNGQSISTTADFEIFGPSGNLLPQASMLTTLDANRNAQGVQVYVSSANKSTLGLTGTQDPIDPGQGATKGIVFSTVASPPTATNSNGQSANQAFFWIQIINAVNIEGTAMTGNVATTTESGLDGTYPYMDWANSATSDRDTPSLTPPATWSQGAMQFDATMYLMWDPALPSGCTPAHAVRQLGVVTQTASNCTSTPIPLGAIRWTWSGCAINTTVPQTNGTDLVIQCGKDHLYGAEYLGYPKWEITAHPL